TPGRRLQLLVGPSDFEQGGAAGGIVDGSVINAIPVYLRADAKVIPVRRVNHVAVFQLRVAAGQARDDVMRIDGSQLIVNGDLRAQAHGSGPEIARGRGGRQFGEIESGCAEKLAGGFL